MLIGKEFYFCIKKKFKHAHTPPFKRHKALLDCSEETHLQILQDLRLQHRKNPLTGYLNINSLRNIYEFCYMTYNLSTLLLVKLNWMKVFPLLDSQKKTTKLGQEETGMDTGEVLSIL